MKNVVYGFGMSVISFLILMIILTTSGRMMRENEIRESLANAVDNAVENCMETNTYEISDRKQFISDVMENLTYQYHSTSEKVRIAVSKADEKEGLLFIKATAYYKNPIGNIGSVEYSKKYLYTTKTRDEGYTINYMIDQDTLYRTFVAKKKDTYPVPDDPTENGKVFIHWVDAEGNVYIKGQSFPATVEDSKTYYAQFSTESVPVTSMTLEASSDKMSVGSMQSLKVTFTPENATNRGLVWSSSDPSVLKVNSVGHVTALKKGEADISVALADGSIPPAAVHIQVTEVTDIRVVADTTFVNDDGSTKKIEVTSPDGDVINADCSYTSSNSSVVTVNSLGVMNTIGNGTAYITVTHRRSGASTILPIMVAEVKDYHGVYDKNAHGISIDCPGAEIMYSEDALGIDAEGWSNVCPTYTDAGTYTVYYKISFSSCTPIEGSAQVTIEKAERALSLSTSEDTLVFPEQKTYTFESEEQDDTQISLTTENNDGCLAATRDGNQITVSSGIKEGDVDLNISIPETKNYKLTTKTIKIHVKNGTMAVDVAVPEGGVYDGENHTILVTPKAGFEDAVVTYASSEDGEYSAIPPECIDAGTHVVYYKVELPGYKTINGSAKVVIDKAPGKLEFNKSEITLTPNSFCLLSVKTNLSEGDVTVTDGNLNKMVTIEKQSDSITVDEVKDEKTGEVLIPASSTKLFSGYKISSGSVKKGTTYIKFMSAESKNYEAADCYIPIYVGEACGIYDKDGNLIIPWDDLTGTLGATIYKDYTEETYKTDETSVYNTVKNFLSGESILSADFSVSNVKLTKIVVPPTRSKIGAYAFAGLDTITDIKFLDGITEIRKDAFSGCTSLKHVTLPDSFTGGEDNLFAGVDVLCYNGTATGSPWGAAKLHDYADGSDKCSYCGTKSAVDEVSLLSASNVAGFMNFRTTAKTFSMPLTSQLYSLIFG